VAAICNLAWCPEHAVMRCWACPMNNMQVAVAPHAAAGAYPTAMRPATAEEADRIVRQKPLAYLRAKTSDKAWDSWELCPPDDPNAVPVYAHIAGVTDRLTSPGSKSNNTEK
jgi:hypothetical protein